jgi:hypothetical protein
MLQQADRSRPALVRRVTCLRQTPNSPTTKSTSAASLLACPQGHISADVHPKPPMLQDSKQAVGSIQHCYGFKAALTTTCQKSEGCVLLLTLCSSTACCLQAPLRDMRSYSTSCQRVLPGKHTTEHPHRREVLSHAIGYTCQETVTQMACKSFMHRGWRNHLLLLARHTTWPVQLQLGVQELKEAGPTQPFRCTALLLGNSNTDITS